MLDGSARHFRADAIGSEGAKHKGTSWIGGGQPSMAKPGTDQAGTSTPKGTTARR